MNISEAKEQIKNAIVAYMSKDEFGDYIIPLERQRPVFLMGPPGIGKTAIMEQIAQELNVGLVSYSMTHHTRQSALGLPFIKTKSYGGKEFSVSEYTMSEIIASVYDCMEETGRKEGILFLDEINCVSETLAPSMLQFLQYKIFGRHRVPNGWIVVTAGNPPEYNNSVREFDTVTWDRLKRIDIEPDFEAWKKYALDTGTHPSVVTYLEIKKADFYRCETTVDGKSFVTARGWSDLSEMIRLYERNNISVDKKLIEQYIQNKKIAADFAVYYDLYHKYRADYQIEKIINGEADTAIIARAKRARFDERLSLLGLLLDALVDEIKKVILFEATQRELMAELKTLREELFDDGREAWEVLDQHAEDRREQSDMLNRSGAISRDQLYVQRKLSAVLSAYAEALKTEKINGGEDAFQLLKADFDARTKELKALAAGTGQSLANVFGFSEAAFADGRELLVLVTELTVSEYASAFISRYGCDAYFKHNKELMFYERQKEIMTEIGSLVLEE